MSLTTSMSDETISAVQKAGRFRATFSALAHRNFRLFWTGAFVSNIGTWMQMVAQGVLVYDLTRSPRYLGVDGFMATVPGLVLTMAGGIFADVIDRRKVLIYTQIGAGLSALVLGILVLTGTVTIWAVLCLSFLTGSCMSLAGPSYQAITIDLATPKDLANAIALNSTQFQLARVLGPALAGLAIVSLGVAACFFANSLSFVAVIVALMLVRIPRADRKESPVSKTFLENLTEGFAYAWSNSLLLWLLVISAVASMFGAPYLSLLPIFANDILKIGSSGYSIMMGTSGAGALAGALTLAFLGDFKGKGLSVLTGALGFELLKSAWRPQET